MVWNCLRILNKMGPERYTWHWREEGSDGLCEVFASTNLDLLISQQSTGKENYRRGIVCWDACDVEMFPRILGYCFHEGIDLVSQIEMFPDLVKEARQFDGEIDYSNEMYYRNAAMDFSNGVHWGIEKNQQGQLQIAQPSFGSLRPNAFVAFPNSQIGSLLYGMMVVRSWPGTRGAYYKQKILLKAFLESPEHGIPRLNLE